MLRGAHPAEHVVGTPREGDEYSEQRREAITKELASMGVDVHVLLDSAEYVGSVSFLHLFLERD